MDRPPLPLNKGQEVEVTSDEQGFEGSWFIAKIIRKSAKRKKRFVVEYRTLVDNKGLKPLREYVYFEHIRPLQPQGATRLFKENQEVDAFYNEGWWKGLIKEVLEDSKYLVEFPTSKEAIVFKQADLRVHMEWKDGKWVNSAEENQEAVERVEVKLDDGACRGAWFPATLVKKISDKSFLVDYKRYSFGNTIKHWTGVVDSINVRPLPPSCRSLHRETFDLLEKVEAFYNFGWLSGVITRVLPDEKYAVFFKHRNEEKEFKRSDLRLHMDWIDSKWFLDTREVTVVVPDEGNGNQTANPSLTTGMDTQVTPSVVIDKSLEKVTSSAANDAGSMDYESAVREADSPCDPLISSQKDTEQSTSKGSNNFLRPHMKVGGQKTADVSMSIKACSERESASTANPPLSTGMDTQVTPSVVVDKSLEKVTSSAANEAGSMDYESAVREADSPCDPLFSNQKDTEQSTTKGSTDFLRPHMKVGGQKTADVSMSIKACSERESASTADPSLSTGMDTQVTPSVVIDKSLKKVTFSAANDAGSMDYESAVREADSPCDPLFSNQKDTVQSTPKGNSDFLRPHMKVGGQKTADISMSMKERSERGMSTGSCNDVEEHSMFSSPTMKGKRSKIGIRRARNSFSSELFFNSFESPKNGNHVSLKIGEEKSKDDLECKSFEKKVSTASSSHLNSDLMEVERSVVLSLSQSNMQCREEQHVVLPTEQMNETSSTPGEVTAEEQSQIAVKRKRGRPIGSGKKKKANTSNSQDSGIISQLKGPVNECTSYENTNVQTQCLEVPSPAVDNHQMPSVLLERSDTSAVEDRGTEIGATHRNLFDEFESMQLTNTKVDTDQTLNLDPEMSDHPINGGGLESESTCTENIAAGAVQDIVCTHSNMQCQEEQHVLLPTEQMNQTSLTPGEDRVNKRSAITIKKSRGRPKGSGKKKKAYTSDSQDIGIISQSKGPENESTCNKNTNVEMQCSELPSSTVENVETQCSELPSSAVDNHQMPSVLFERSDTSAVEDRGTEIEAANRNLADKIDSMQLINTNVDTDQTLNLDLEMFDHPIDGRGLESEMTCTENIAAGTFSDSVCAQIFTPTIEEHQTLSPTPDHAIRATECEAVLDVTTGQITHVQVPCPSILEKPLIVESNEDIHVALDEARDERDTPVDSVMDLPQPSRDVEIATQNSPPLEINQDQQISLFEKKSSMWKVLEGSEAFKSNPQNPHFHPLENELEELREGKALGLMCAFETLVTRTSNASIEEERHVFQNRLVALDELDEYGFKVGLMRSKLEKMVEIKDRLDELGNRPDTSKLDINKLDIAEAEDQLKELEASIENLKLQLQTLLAGEEKARRNLASLRRLADEAQRLRLEFHDLAAAP